MRKGLNDLLDSKNTPDLASSVESSFPALQSKHSVAFFGLTKAVRAQRGFCISELLLCPQLTLPYKPGIRLSMFIQHHHIMITPSNRSPPDTFTVSLHFSHQKSPVQVGCWSGCFSSQVPLTKGDVMYLPQGQWTCMVGHGMVGPVGARLGQKRCGVQGLQRIPSKRDPSSHHLGPIVT